MTSKRTNYFRVFVLLAIYLGIFGFLMRKNTAMPVILGSMAATFVAIYAFLASRRAVDFVVAHPKALRFCGMAMMATAFLMIPAAVLAFPQMKPDNLWLMGAVLGAVTIGALLITLPRSAQYQAKIFSGEIKPLEKSTADFNGPREAMDSIKFVFQHWPAFFSIAGVWAILYAVVPLAAAQYTAQKTGLIAHVYDAIPAKANTEVALATVLAWVVIDLVATPIVAVACHRYVFEGTIPRWGLALPSRGTVRYIFVLWIFSATVATFDKLIASNGHDLSTLIGSHQARLVVEIAQDLFALLAIWMFGTFALILPSSVLKGSRMDIQGAVRASHALGRSHPLGLLVALLPGLAINFALVKLINYAAPNSISAQQSSMILPSVFYFIAVASGATYLSRAYLAAAAAQNSEPALSGTATG